MAPNRPAALARWLPLLALPLLAAPVSADPTLDLDQRIVIADTQPPFSNPGVSDTPDAPFVLFDSLVTQGDSVSCPQTPTNTSSAASQESTVSPLFFEGIGSASYLVDGGHCEPASADVTSRYRIRFTTDADYAFDLEATLERGNILIENDDGTDFVSVADFTGPFSDTQVLPPDTYILVVEVDLDGFSGIQGAPDSSSGSFDFTLPEPGTAVTLLPGAAVLGLLRRRRRRA
jgi:hypothetical protein